MSLQHIFYTATRAEFGRLYLGLIRGFEPEMFTSLDHVPIVAMRSDYASSGKSLAADVMFHEILDGYDPADVIDGRETKKLTWEEYPCEAMGFLLDVKGRLQGRDVPVTLGFNSWPDIMIKDQSVFESDERLCQAYRDKFKACFEDAQQATGGLIFAAALRCLAADVAIRTESSNSKYWARIHEIHVNAPSLQRSPKFQEAWSGLVEQFGHQPDW